MVKQLAFQKLKFSHDQLIALADEDINESSEFRIHQHPWGQIIFVRYGVVTLHVDEQRFIAPLGFAIWIPPNYQHSCFNDLPTRFRSINICEAEANKLSQAPSLLKLSDIALSIIDSFFERETLELTTEQDFRKSLVLIDELHNAMIGHTYLPYSEHRLLRPILQTLERDPANRMTLHEWAQHVFTTERTLARYFKKELGMSFNEWCQRLRFIHSISLLEQGQTVEEIAFNVGYRSTSSFINMFHSLSGTTPKTYKKLQKNM